MIADERPLEQLELSSFAATEETLLPPADVWTPSCLVYTNFLALAPVAGSQHLSSLYVAKDHHMDGVVLAKLHRGTELIVAGGEDFIPWLDGRVLTHQMPPYWPKESISAKLLHPRPRIDVDGSAVLIARFGLRTWGHWLGELLPKMVCVEAAFPGKHRFVLPATVFFDPLLRPILESIWYHGIDLARIVPVQPETIYRFSELYAVSPVWTRNKLHPGAVELMQSHIMPVPQGLPRKVAFLRTESRTRNVANAQAVIDELVRQGFTIVEIGTLPFADQVATFAAADTVVAVLGSGLSGLPYSPTGVRVLTLAPSDWSDLFFFAMMQTRDAKLADIRGRQDPSDTRRPAEARFIVELYEVQKGLQELGI